MNGNISISQIVNLSKQYKYLETIQKDLRGMYILPREKDIFTWDGIIFITEGVWEEGIFKFTLSLSPDNGVKPVLKFVTPLFHPYVNVATNCLDIQFIHPNWKTDPNTIATLLIKVANMFYEEEFDANLCTNPEAAKYFHSTDVVKRSIHKKIRDCVNASILKCSDPIPGASLVFAKPADSDIDGYNRVIDKMGLQYSVCSKFNSLFFVVD